MLLLRSSNISRVNSHSPIKLGSIKYVFPRILRKRINREIRVTGFSLFLRLCCTSLLRQARLYRQLSVISQWHSLVKCFEMTVCIVGVITTYAAGTSYLLPDVQLEGLTYIPLALLSHAFSPKSGLEKEAQLLQWLHRWVTQQKSQVTLIPVTLIPTFTEPGNYNQSLLCFKVATYWWA